MDRIGFNVEQNNKSAAVTGAGSAVSEVLKHQ